MPVQTHHTFQNAATATGNGTSLLVRGASLLSVDVTFTGTAVGLFEGLIGETGTWRTLLAINRANMFLVASTATTAHYQVDVEGLDQVRFRISSYSSGTVTATGRLTNGPRPWMQSQSVVSGGTISGVVAPPAVLHYMSSSNALPVTAAQPLPVSATLTTASVLITASFTRPNDTTAYAAGDAVTNSTSAPAALTFTSAADSNGGSGMIVGARLVDSAAQATKGQFELWVFAGAAAPTPDNDNAAFTPTDAELANIITVIPFTTPYTGDATAGAGGNCVYLADGVNAVFKCDSGTPNLFGLVVVRNAYTPVAQEVFTCILQIVQD